MTNPRFQTEELLRISPRGIPNKEELQDAQWLIEQLKPSWIWRDRSQTIGFGPRHLVHLDLQKKTPHPLLAVQLCRKHKSQKGYTIAAVKVHNDLAEFSVTGQEQFQREMINKTKSAFVRSLMGKDQLKDPLTDHFVYLVRKHEESGTKSTQMK